jgi:hypothetical protein
MFGLLADFGSPLRILAGATRLLRSARRPDHKFGRDALGAAALVGIATPTPATCLATLGNIAARLETVTATAIETLATRWHRLLPIMTIIEEVRRFGFNEA